MGSSLRNVNFRDDLPVAIDVSKVRASTQSSPERKMAVGINLYIKEFAIPGDLSFNRLQSISSRLLQIFARISAFVAENRR